jgi:hypothetical protein
VAMSSDELQVVEDFPVTDEVHSRTWLNRNPW